LVDFQIQVGVMWWEKLPLLAGKCLFKEFGWAKIHKAHPLTTSRRREEIGTPSSLVSSSNPLMPSPAILGQIFSF